MNNAQKILLQARKTYSGCAAVLEKKIGAGGLTCPLSEQVVGVGIAADWVRRAAEMEGIIYIGKHLNESQRKQSFIELLRYGFAWFGLNAIFSRLTLLSLVGTPSAASEFARFQVLFDATPVTNTQGQTRTLQNILAMPTAPRLPNTPVGTTVTTLLAIDTKYVPSTIKKMTTAKTVSSAAAAGNVTALDLPTLLYAFRNWAVHGNALDGGFGSRPRFLNYVGVLLEVLAEIHLSTASALLAKI